MVLPSRLRGAISRWPRAAHLADDDNCDACAEQGAVSPRHRLDDGSRPVVGIALP
ncbi:hypothetical protein ACFTWS_30710 [Streptomyces sp. NPDC057027]|uniref:hypothetical protein n=1 Tax=Streptomyces sp. NPDC057027 TaxID=3346004 RepID=UPI003624D0C3